MKLIKHYDFTNMSSLPTEDWNIAVGEKWSNNELQHYVDSKENMYFDNGLVLKATYDGTTIRSTRINTKNKFSFKYGKIDIIAKVPKGVGTWPALWMMPLHNKYGHWPRSGEIDIMEHVGRDLDKLFLCIHTESYNHTNGIQYYDELVVPGLSDDFQTFSLIWTESSIEYLLNDKSVVKYEKGHKGFSTDHKGWPFDEEFYFIINLAIGGKFGGEVDYSMFPQEFIVKDVKIYK